MTQGSPQSPYLPEIHLTDENPTLKRPVKFKFYKFLSNRMGFSINLHPS